MKEAYFAGGCFWCIAKPYDEIEGVIKVESGFSGGEGSADYESVKAQKTMHRETVKITYDETRLSFHELLKTYFYNVDPFDDGGQFVDRGRSYTLAVYYTDENERFEAESAIKNVEAETGRKVFVSVEKFKEFYKAEEYHQDYAKKNPEEFLSELKTSGRADVKESERIRI